MCTAYKPTPSGHEAPKFNPRGKKQDASKVIVDALEKTVSSLGLEIRTAYSVPYSFKLDPITHKPHNSEPSHPDYLIDICIGKKIAEDSDIMIPKICIEVDKGANTGDFMKFIKKVEKVKQNYNFARWGIIAYGVSTLDKNILNPSFLNNFDFIYAMGDFMESEGKLQQHLTELVEEQNVICDKLFDILHKDEVRRFIKTNIIF